MDDLNGYVRVPNLGASGNTTGNCIPRVPSFPKMKPHFIIKEYYGKSRRESQSFYLEEKYCQSQRPKSIVANAIQESITSNALSNAIVGVDGGISRNKQRSMLENVALFGGAFVGGILGLYVCNNN
jgi:hypothetical protein